MDLEKIQMMTRLAIFEKKEGKEIREVSRYFKSDYVSTQVFKAILHYTLCFFLVALLAVLIQLETILMNLNLSFLSGMAWLFFMVYLMGLVVTVLLSGFGAAAHYDHAFHMGEIYRGKLEQLLNLEESGDAVRYAKQEATKYMQELYPEEKNGTASARPSKGRKQPAKAERQALQTRAGTRNVGHTAPSRTPETDWLDDDYTGPGIDVLDIRHKDKRS